MNIFVSLLVPSLQDELIQTEISDYNDNPAKMAEANGLQTINPVPFFRLENGDIDDSCYQAHEPYQGSLLNRHGVARLLKAMSNQYRALKYSIRWEHV